MSLGPVPFRLGKELHYCVRLSRHGAHFRMPGLARIAILMFDGVELTLGS